MKINITTSIDPVIHQSARDNDIGWNDALEFGIRFLIAEKEGVDYPNCKLISIKMANLSKLLAEKCAEIETLKNPVVVDPIKEADDILKNAGVSI